MFFAVMLLGGVYLPRIYLLPEVLIRIGDFTPPGRPWAPGRVAGTAPQVPPLLGMAVVTIVRRGARGSAVPMGVTRDRPQRALPVAIGVE